VLLIVSTVQHSHYIRSWRERQTELTKSSTVPLLPAVGGQNRYESEKVEKIMASSAQPTRLSKLSFPRYTTSLATPPWVRQSLALHILHAARGTHVSDHQQPFARVLTSQNGELCCASARCHVPTIFSSPYAGMATHRVRSLLRSEPHSAFVHPPMTLLPSPQKG